VADSAKTRSRSPGKVVAGWLRERAPGSAHAALLALHYDLGGDVRAATEAYERAAAHASSLGQNAEALRHLLRACELCDELQEEGAPAVPWRDQARVRLDLGDVLRRLGRLDEAEAAYAKARAGILKEDPEAPRWEARADFRMALSLKVRGSTAAARELVERALALAKEGGIPEETPAMHELLAPGRRSRQRAGLCGGLVRAWSHRAFRRASPRAGRARPHAGSLQ
jgi:tetratricopeptide (TPR) repeat protein